MNTLLIIVATVMGAASSQLTNGDRGPTNPIVPLDCSDPLQFAADEKNQCWYYQCTPQGVIPMPCSVGTHVHFDTRLTRSNPCSERFPINGPFDCTRRPDPVCNFAALCLNGGVAKTDGSLCWCDCPILWQGAPDCSVRIPPNYGQPVDAAPCPFVDWCAMALPLGRNPCQNGGTCINQCNNFICECMRPYVKDRLCSSFSCSGTNAEQCPPPTQCTRGVNARDEFFMCM